jgi:predicted nucleotidyltransferase
MISLTKKERETLLILFKESTNFYNANSISKVLKISHVGAQKIFKRLREENLVINKTIGKSIIYKLTFNDQYVTQLITFLLADEATNFKRWKEEFKELFKKNRTIVLFGSAVKDYAHAKDIDLMIIMESKEIKEVNGVLKKKEAMLPKKLHAIKLTSADVLTNLQKKDEVTIDIIKNGIVLYGQQEYVEMVKTVAGF